MTVAEQADDGADWEDWSDLETRPTRMNGPRRQAHQALLGQAHQVLFAGDMYDPAEMARIDAAAAMYSDGADLAQAEVEAFGYSTIEIEGGSL